MVDGLSETFALFRPLSTTSWCSVLTFHLFLHLFVENLENDLVRFFSECQIRLNSNMLLKLATSLVKDS